MRWKCGVEAGGGLGAALGREKTDEEGGWGWPQPDAAHTEPSNDGAKHSVAL